MEYRFLTGIDFREIHRAFLEAFADYVVPMHSSREHLEEMLLRRGADLELSVGAFDDGWLVGFNLNALGLYRSRLTLYDVATGIVPSSRRKGVAAGLFEFSLPKLRETKAEQYVLEVIRTNQPAVSMYQKVGFQTSRAFEAFRRTSPVQESRVFARDLGIREMEPDWRTFETFWDWHPSWQNSTQSLQRSGVKKIVLGAMAGGSLIGYGIVFPYSGDIPQFAVHPDYRRTGVGAALLNGLQRNTNPGLPVHVVNVDASAIGTLTFLRNQGFEHFLSQHEMKLDL